jgi:hypothetical protein
MTQSNIPNIPPPPEPPTSDPSRNRDEWIAVLVALLAMGGIFFWVFGTDRPNGSLLSRRSGSSSTQVEDLPGLSELLQDSDSFDTSIPSARFDRDQAVSGSNSALLSPNSSASRRRAWQAWRLRTLQQNRQQVQIVPEVETEEELETPVEGETPLEATDNSTPVEGNASETTDEATEEETTEDPTVAPTDETETPDTEAEQSQDTDESADTTAEQSQRPRFGIPILGLGSKPEALGSKTDTEETDAATEETPTEATATDPEAEDTPTEATVTDSEEEEAEIAEAEDTPTEATVTDSEEEETTAEQSQGPRLGIPILGLGSKPEALGSKTDTEETDAATEETPTEATVTAPEAEDTPAEATANADQDEDVQADGSASPTEEEQATAAKSDKPSLGISIPGFGRNRDNTAASGSEFSDVPDDFWAKDYVQYFVQQDIITGYKDGTFKPEEPMSRAAVAAQIEEAYGFAEIEREKALNFEDVTQEFWAESAIDETTKTGFLAGYPGDVFRPERPMTRTEVLVALVSGLDLKPSGDPQEILSVYQDADQIPEWAVEKVAAATEAGLVASYPNTDTFNPNEPATRAEVSAMIYQGLVQAGKVDAMSSEYIVNPKK